jgi:hypothetical protein
MKSEVYSWRLSSGLKSDLERAGRQRKLRLAAVLEIAAREWLARNAADVAADEEQKRIHSAAAPFIGALSGTNPQRAETASRLIRDRLRRRYGSR